MVTLVKALTTPEQSPMLHLWDTNIAARQWTSARIVEHTIAVAETLRPGIEAVIRSHRVRCAGCHGGRLPAARLRGQLR